MTNKNNTRRYERFNLECMDIQSNIILAKYVKLHDISLGGVSFQTDKRLSIGNEYIPRIADKNSTMQVKGKVVWSSLTESVSDSLGNVVPIYKVGMEFLHMSDNQIEDVADFINSLRKEESTIDVVCLDNKRAHVRFLLDNPEEISLDYASSFQIQNISLNGLLIESEQPVNIGLTTPLVVIFEENEIIKLLGKVVRLSEKRDKPGHYDLGIEFVDMSDKEKEVVTSFVKSHRLTD